MIRLHCTFCNVLAHVANEFATQRLGLETYQPIEMRASILLNSAGIGDSDEGGVFFQLISYLKYLDYGRFLPLKKKQPRPPFLYTVL